MTKFRWNESTIMFRDHVDPEKEEQLKSIIVETDTKVERIVKLVKTVNSGNKDAKQRKRSEVIQLIEDFYKQYQSMCSLYEDLRQGVKKKCNNEEDKEDNESCSSSYSYSMESAAYLSQGSGSKTPSIDQPKVITTDGQSMKSENSCYSLEALSVESSYKEDERANSVEKLMKETENLRDHLGVKENKYPNLENKSPSKIKALEDRVIALKLEIEALNCQKSEHEQEFKGRHDDFHKRLKDNSGFQLEIAFKEKEGDILKKLDECEKFYSGKIEESMDRVQNLQMKVDSLQSQNEKVSYEKEKELESLRVQNIESEMELEKKTKEAADLLKQLETLTEKLKQKSDAEDVLIEERNRLKKQVEDLDNSGFQLEIAFKEKEGDILKRLDECEKFFSGRIEESIDQVKNLQMEVNSLRSQNEKFSYEKDKELDSLRIQNNESEMDLEKKTKEAADLLKQLETLTEKLKQKSDGEEVLIEERNSLKKQVEDLEVKIESVHEEKRLIKSENENQREMISELKEKLQAKDGQISSLESKLEGVKRDLTNKMKSLEQKFKSLEIDKKEIEGKNDVLATTLEQRDILVSRLNHEAKSSFRTTVKKMGEMVDEFRKKSEDSIRILSRRIRVAEQLHNETREWYKKTREKNEQDRKDNELALQTIKTTMSTASEALDVSETFGHRFTECCEDFANRVSKVSCEIHFAKDWVKRKNTSMAQVKEDLNALVVQLDDKEEEILGSRQKVLKLENKLRDLEKIVKENDETMIVLKEEKREAIRQLCVWIDYHRSRSDFFKKAFSEVVARAQRPG